MSTLETLYEREASYQSWICEELLAEPRDMDHINYLVEKLRAVRAHIDREVDAVLA